MFRVVDFAFSVEKSTPAGKKYASGAGGAGDKLQLWWSMWSGWFHLLTRSLCSKSQKWPTGIFSRFLSGRELWHIENMNQQTNIQFSQKCGLVFEEEKYFVAIESVSRWWQSVTWVKSCWCFLPSVGKHPFYGLHMPSKPLQLPPLCMYIVNVLPFKFLISILEKYL